MGESAGGGLAAGLALLARDRGEHQLAFQHLIYPMIDDRTCTADDPHPFAGEFVWTPSANRFGWTSLLGHEPGRAGVSPYAAAARAEDLSRLPPTYIATGALDLFVEENFEYARRLIRAGVPTELHVYPGAFHGFQWAAQSEVAMAAARDTRAALVRALVGSFAATPSAVADC
jgi:triacylglycerol lipase